MSTPSLNNPSRLKAWVITQLAAELNADLALCTNELERSNCRAVYTAEMRGLRDEKIKQNQSFTPGEIAVLKEHGIALPGELNSLVLLSPVDQVKDGLAGLIDTALKVNDLEWAAAIERAGTNKPTDSGRAAEQSIQLIERKIKESVQDLVRFRAILTDESYPAAVRMASVLEQMEQTIRQLDSLNKAQ